MAYGPSPIKRDSVISQAAQEICRIIEAERLAPGDTLPPETRLSQMLGISRNSVREALRSAAQHPPDVALMDIRLPDGDGIDAARQIRDRHGARIVFVTGNTDPETLLRIGKFGGAPLVPKPISIDGLRRAIQRACRDPE